MEFSFYNVTITKFQRRICFTVIIIRVQPLSYLTGLFQQSIQIVHSGKIIGPPTDKNCQENFTLCEWRYN